MRKFRLWFVCSSVPDPCVSPEVDEGIDAGVAHGYQQEHRVDVAEYVTGNKQFRSDYNIELQIRSRKEGGGMSQMIILISDLYPASLLADRNPDASRMSWAGPRINIKKNKLLLG